MSKRVIRAVIQYDISTDYWALRLYFDDKTTELFQLAEGVKSQLKAESIPEDHHEWLKAFKSA